MSLLSNFLLNIKKRTAFSSFKAYNRNFDDTVKRPLLTQQQLMELQIRAKRKHSLVSQQKQTAYQQMGDIHSLYRGIGLDYEESRQYQPGDDPRYINWRLAAKSGQLFTKVFREDRQPGVFILLDRRASMRFGTKIRLKVAQAARVAAVIAFFAQQRSAVVSSVLLNSKPRWLAEAQNQHEVLSLVQGVCSACPPDFNKADRDDETTLIDILRQLQVFLSAGSQIYIISDFIEINSQYQSILAQLASQHSVHALHIFDPAEIRLPKAGQLRLYPQHPSGNTVSGLSIDTESAITRREFRQEVSNHFSQIESCFRSLNVSYVQISTMLDNVENRIPFV